MTNIFISEDELLTLLREAYEEGRGGIYDLKEDAVFGILKKVKAKRKAEDKTRSESAISSLRTILTHDGSGNATLNIPADNGRSGSLGEIAPSILARYGNVPLVGGPNFSEWAGSGSWTASSTNQTNPADLSTIARVDYPAISGTIGNGSFSLLASNNSSPIVISVSNTSSVPLINTDE